MNAEQLLAHFERISEAPDAISRLRRFVLDLAVRGKLVDQDPEDEPAGELLQRLKPAKALAYELEGLRARQSVSSANRDDLWFEIPGSWALPCFDDIFVIVSGVTKGQRIPLSESIEVPYLRVANVQRGSLDLSQIKTIGVRIPDVERYRLKDQDILMTEGGDWDKLGRAAIWADQIPDCIHQNHVFRLRVPTDELIPEWVILYANSDPGRKFFEDCSKQTTNLASINMTQLRSCPLPLPPLAEQHRIVAKVDELMALCDQLEAARQQREQCRERLVAATLQRLNQPAEDPASFRQDASFALQVLPSLTTTPAQIKQLRQTILNLAVRGKLVAGSLGRIAAVGDYRRLQNGYAFKSGWFAKSGIRLLRNVNVGHGQIRWNDVAHIPEERFSEFARFSLEEGDIVLTLDRPFIVTGTKVARVNVCDLPALLLQRVGRFVEIAPGVDDDYLFLWINSPHFIEQIDPGRSNGVPHISSKQVEAASILIPPLAEQHRIVAKVDELMALCDQLEQQLSQADQQRRRLLEAVLAEALVGRLTTEQKESHAAIA
jgi:type I restriction enzyme S subunit